MVMVVIFLVCGIKKVSVIGWSFILKFNKVLKIILMKCLKKLLEVFGKNIKKSYIMLLKKVIF